MTPTIRLRPVEPHETALIFSFLTIAARMAESQEPIQKALVDGQLTKYWQAWGRDGDLGVVAIRADDGMRVSCAWVRCFEKGDPAYVAENIRELAIGTVASECGGGIGTKVLGLLIDVCRPACGGISLSVRAENPAVRLYERFGFVRCAEIANRVGAKSLTMLLRLPSAASLTPVG